jgi:glycogen debranching enzyme
MMHGLVHRLSLGVAVLLGPAHAMAAKEAPTTPRFSLEPPGLVLAAPARRGRFFSVAGRRAAVFGYENVGLEGWVYPLKLLDDLQLSFRLEGYPLEIESSAALVRTSVRPEATVLTYSHAAFTVREVLLVPLDEPGIVVLLDVDSVLPMTVSVRFRPRLRPMWPAGLMTPNVDWDEKQARYRITEESRRFVGIVGSPAAKDVSLMPYQEEPRDIPLRFEIAVSAERARSELVPIVVAASTTGRKDAESTYDRLLGSVPELYRARVEHQRALEAGTVSVTTPEPRLDSAFRWAKAGIDKGLATNPALGTGLLAGFRTSGDSERPGFAWFFGRDALWTALATTAYGDLATTRTALEFLRRFQREDGKVPHEISQSAALVPWFAEYPYPWNSADATPLYVIAHGDHFRTTGDKAFLENSWSSILKAWHFTAASDTDGNGLVENTSFGHGWVEGGALYPAHEEIYMQGAWIEACRALAEMATAMGEGATAARAREAAERTRAAVERAYWIEGRGYYAFATARPREEPPKAEPGPYRERRQARLEQLAKGGLVDEDTVLPAVPLWWGTLDGARADSEIDHLGAAALATDWGQRLLADTSLLYDPLSYHYGSVWPLFTGWTAVAAYRYGRPLVGFQALMANALLTETGALGSVTELLSGDVDAPFGRSSHHQVWSQAMVAAPLLRGLLGIEATDGGTRLRFAPLPPADWDRVSVGNVPAGAGRYDLDLERTPGRLTLTAARRTGSGEVAFTFAPAIPLDARVRSVEVDGQPVQPTIVRIGDVQRVEVPGRGPLSRMGLTYDEGTEVVGPVVAPGAGDRSEGLRVLRARPDGSKLLLLLEGRGGRTYAFRVRSPRRPGSAPGATVRGAGPGEWGVGVTFEGPDDGYRRREVVLPLGPP